MRKLLSADFYRLGRDKAFWTGALAMLAYTVGAMLGNCHQAMEDVELGFPYALETFYFVYAFPIGLLISVFTSLFLGSEYSDGTIRNKLVVGHKRSDVYLSKLFANIAFSLILLFFGLLGGLCGIPFLGLWKVGNMIWVYLLVSVFFTVSYAAVFTLTGMLCTNKAVSAVWAILLFLILFILSFHVYAGLMEPEVSHGLLITKEGMQMGDPSPNPNYISGLEREIYQFIIDVLPTGQCIQLEEFSVQHPLRMMISSLVIAVGTTVCGIWAFGRKDLK